MIVINPNIKINMTNAVLCENYNECKEEIPENFTITYRFQNKRRSILLYERNK